MSQNTNDLAEPLINHTTHFSVNNLDSHADNEPLRSASTAEYTVDEGGEPLRGDVRLNQATAALAATIIGTQIYNETLLAARRIPSACYQSLQVAYSATLTADF